MIRRKRGHVVIVGAGFGGLAAAQALANHNVDVTVVDRRNHHLFQPLLYQVATAGLSPAEIATPIRSILAPYKNIRVIFANVTEIDKTKNIISTSMGQLAYDVLVLACGSKHSYFGNEHWEEHAPGLKTLEQATEIRRRILMSFEQAENTEDVALRKEYQTFIIVGGGPTGVELAGAIAEISRMSLKADFRKIRPDRTRVILIEGGDRVLPQFAEHLSARAARDLEELGVQVWTSTRVTRVTPEGVELANETVRAKTVVWAAGVKPSGLNQKLGSALDKQGRVIVNPDLSLPGFQNVYVIGDQAAAKAESGNFLPGLASVAAQQGKYVADRILGSSGSEKMPFRYKDKGIMATIGRRRAVVQVGTFTFAGMMAWLTWLFVHVYLLIGFRNRIFVFMNWAVAYMTFSRGARLITENEWRFERAASKPGEPGLKIVIPPPSVEDKAESA